MKKNTYFIIDFDSTLVQLESLDVLAEIALHNKKDKELIVQKIQEITQLGMEGKISFEESLSRRLELFQPTKKDIEATVQLLRKNITSSVLEYKDFFKENKNNIYIISGGFKGYIVPIAEILEIPKDHILANEFLFNDDIVVGYDIQNVLSKAGGKTAAVHSLNLDGDIFIIGDGYTDYEIKKENPQFNFIAFTENIARESVIKNADFVAQNFQDVTTFILQKSSQRKVLLLENINQYAVDYFQQKGFCVETISHALCEEELIEKIKDVSILGIRSKTKVTENVLRSAKKLQVVGAFCIGLDQIDLDAAEKYGITVFNAPYSNTRSVAELAIGEIIMLMRKVFEKSMQLHNGEWNKSATGCYEIRGKKLGIVGYGNIGSQISIMAECLGMNIVYYDIADKLPHGNAQKCETLEEVLSTADVVTIHVDGRLENKNLISKKEFELMKNGVIFLNLSRGKVVDIEALVQSIHSGKVAGVAVDVYPKEPEKNGQAFYSVLQGLPNVILTPHIAGSTEEAQSDIGKYVSRKIVDFIQL